MGSLFRSPRWYGTLTTSTLKGTPIFRTTLILVSFNQIPLFKDRNIFVRDLVKIVHSVVLRTTVQGLGTRKNMSFALSLIRNCAFIWPCLVLSNTTRSPMCVFRFPNYPWHNLCQPANFNCETTPCWTAQVTS